MGSTPSSRLTDELFDPDVVILGWFIVQRGAAVLSEHDISFARGMAARATTRSLTPGQERRLSSLARRVGAPSLARARRGRRR
jgi:hypothetical protein